MSSVISTPFALTARGLGVLLATSGLLACQPPPYEGTDDGGSESESDDGSDNADGNEFGESGTSSSTETGEPPCVPGTEGCACYEGDCFGDLVCASNFCVDLGDESDSESGDSDTTDGDTGDGDGDGDPTGDTNEPDSGVQPGNGAMYAQCFGNGDCQQGLFCQTFLTNGVVTDGFCTWQYCDTNGCAPPPGETADPICFWNGAWECGLSCAFGDCPQGMYCGSGQGYTDLCI